MKTRTGLMEPTFFKKQAEAVVSCWHRGHLLQQWWQGAVKFCASDLTTNRRLHLLQRCASIITGVTTKAPQCSLTAVWYPGNSSLSRTHSYVDEMWQLRKYTCWRDATEQTQRHKDTTGIWVVFIDVFTAVLWGWSAAFQPRGVNNNSRAVSLRCTFLQNDLSAVFPTS